MDINEKVMQMLLMKKKLPEICHEISNYLIHKYNFKTISGKKDNQIFVYKEGYYNKCGKEIIQQESEKILGSIASSHYINEIVNKVMRKTFIDRSLFVVNDKNLICVKNGVLNIRTKELLEHSSDYYFSNKINVNFDSNAKINKIIDFLFEVISEDDILAIQEWFGYCLYREYFIKKAIIFRGVKDTGKTTFLRLLIKYIGSENISNKSLQLLAQGKWQLAKLYSKFCNIGDDLSYDDVENMGIIKQLTGRSPIDAEFKFGDSFEFINYSKLMFACNKIPNIKGDVDDDAFWDRWMIFDFDNVFSKKDKNTKTHIIDDITSDEEMSGLLNWALKGLDRLINDGYFSYKRTWEMNKKIMQGEASSIAKFNDMCIISSFGDWISNADFYDKYKEFCLLNMITPETERKFFLDIRKYCSNGKFNNQKTSGVFGVRNIKIKDDLPILNLL